MKEKYSSNYLKTQPAEMVSYGETLNSEYFQVKKKKITCNCRTPSNKCRLFSFFSFPAKHSSFYFNLSHSGRFLGILCTISFLYPSPLPCKIRGSPIILSSHNFMQRNQCSSSNQVQ